MDDFHIHLHPFPRCLSGPPRVHSLGRFRAKDHPVRGRCVHTGLSLIWSGRGRFACDGRSWPVNPPCALWEPHGSRVDYGPAPYWEEFFIVWLAEDTPLLERCGLLGRDRQGRPFRAGGEIAALVDRLVQLARHPATPGAVDRIDRLAEQLAAEVALGGRPAPADPMDEALEGLRRRIDTDPLAAPEAAALARRLGCHPHTVARRWLATVGEPLARYRLRQRLRLAAARLSGGDEPVVQVAAASGFADPLHFSRRFSQEFGLCPRAYRRHHRLVCTAIVPV